MLWMVCLGMCGQWAGQQCLWYGILWIILSMPFNALRPRQNGRHFPNAIFKCIFLNENVWIPIKISPTFVPRGPINNIPALAQIMAWRHPGVKPLSEPMMVSLAWGLTQYKDPIYQYRKSHCGDKTVMRSSLYWISPLNEITSNCIRHFHICFLEWKWLWFDSNFIEIQS